MKVDINLQKVDIDQCSSDGWFSGTHKCHLNNSEVRIPGLDPLKLEAKAWMVLTHVLFVWVNEHVHPNEKTESVQISVLSNEQKEGRKEHFCRETL